MAIWKKAGKILKTAGGKIAAAVACCCPSGDTSVEYAICCTDACPTDCTGCPTNYKFTASLTVPGTTVCGGGGATCANTDGNQACFDRGAGTLCTFSTAGGCTGNDAGATLQCTNIFGKLSWWLKISGGDLGSCSMDFYAPIENLADPCCPPTEIADWIPMAGCEAELTDITATGGSPSGSKFVDPTKLSSSEPYPSHVRIDGDCYSLIGGSSTAINTSEIEGEHDACDCAEPCPSDCDGCDDSYKVVLSVSNPTHNCFMGSQCSIIDGDVFCFEKHATIDCQWDKVASCASCTESGTHDAASSIKCIDDEWVMALHGVPGLCAVRLVAPVDLSGCPPLTGWVDEDGTSCNGSVTVTKFATC